MKSKILFVLSAMAIKSSLANPESQQKNFEQDPYFLNSVARWHCITPARLMGNEPGRMHKMAKEYLRALDQTNPGHEPEPKCVVIYRASSEHCTQEYLESLAKDYDKDVGPPLAFTRLKAACGR